MNSKIIGIRTASHGVINVEDLKDAMNVHGCGKVIWEDGSESWGKIWLTYDKVLEVWFLERIGAGANGDCTVWTREHGYRVYEDPRMIYFTCEDGTSFSGDSAKVGV